MEIKVNKSKYKYDVCENCDKTDKENKINIINIAGFPFLGLCDDCLQELNRKIVDHLEEKNL